MAYLNNSNEYPAEVRQVEVRQDEEHQRAHRLLQLERRVRHDLEAVSYPAKPWLFEKQAPDGSVALDAVIVGAGQSGLSIAFALKQEKVERILLLDRSPEGREGPWVTFARMKTLRTPKKVTGPDLGIPSLTISEWYRARYGDLAWETLGKVPKGDWMAYLVWLRQVLGLQVRNHSTVVGFGACEEDRSVLWIDVLNHGNIERIFARRLIFATGIEGSGNWQVPAMVSGSLPHDSYYHTSQAIDFEAMKGKRIGILGAGASAFDNAATALECGAARVELFYRRNHLPRVNPYRWVENAGFLGHFADMPDQWKWRFFKLILDGNQPPPQETYDRCAQFANFILHPGEPWTGLQQAGESVQVTTQKGDYAFDKLIIGTGIDFDLVHRPELGPYVKDIAVWQDRHHEALSDPNPQLRNMPYLGSHFEFLEKTPGTLPWAGKVFHFTFGSTLSMGLSAGALSGLKYGVQRVTKGIVKSLYLEDVEAFYEDFRAYDVPELVIPDHL